MSQFAADGFVLIENVLDDSQRLTLREHILKRCLQSGHDLGGDRLVPTAPSKYADPLTERILDQLVPRVESMAQCEVWPTYSYYRFYRTGDCLPEHRDRPACEISLTITIDYQAPRPWPLFVRNYAGDYSIEIPGGWALLYKGAEIYHWRKPFDGEWAAQVFLHYVNRHGPFGHLRFDGRAGLGLPFPRPRTVR